MSRKRQPGAYTEEDILDLRSRYSNEKVAYLLSQQALETEEVEEDDEDLLGSAESEPADPAQAPAPKGSGLDYGALKVDELVEVLKARGLSTEGRKADLVARLEQADSAA